MNATKKKMPGEVVVTLREQWRVEAFRSVKNWYLVDDHDDIIATMSGTDDPRMRFRARLIENAPVGLTLIEQLLEDEELPSRWRGLLLSFVRRVKEGT